MADTVQESSASQLATKPMEPRSLVAPLLALLLVIGFFLGPLKLLGNSWVSYLGADVVAVIILLVVAAERLIRHEPLIAASPLSIPLVLLATLCILELANPEAPFVRSVLGLRSWLLYLAFYFVGLYSLRSLRQLKHLYALLLGLGLLTAVYGIYQWREGPQLFATWSDYYSVYALRLAWVSSRTGAVFRAFSTYVLPNTFGSNMALLMLLALSVTASPRIRLGWRCVAAGTFAVMGVGIAASGSRGPIAHLLLAAAIGFTLLPGIRGRLTLLIVSVVLATAATTVVLLLIGPVVSERFSTMVDPQAFFWKWFIPFENGIKIAIDHPFGMGMGYTAGVPRFIVNPTLQTLPTINIDSGYGSAAAELGLIGLAVFAYVAVKVGLEGIRVWKSLAPGLLRDLLLGPALLAATYPIVSLVFQPQATLPSSIYSWLLIGMLMKAPALQRTSIEDQPVRP